MGILSDEISTDPLARGYAAMTDEEIVADLATEYRDVWLPLTSSQIFEAMVPAEFVALTAADKARVDRIFGLGSGIQTFPGARSRAELVAVFGGASATIAALAAIANPMQSRAAELKIPVPEVYEVRWAREELA